MVIKQEGGPSGAVAVTLKITRMPLILPFSATILVRLRRSLCSFLIFRPEVTHLLTVRSHFTAVQARITTAGRCLPALAVRNDADCPAFCHWLGCIAGRSTL